MSWAILGESVIGTSHVNRGDPCQDHCRAQVFGESGEWLVAVAADGAGSATHAAAGATLACAEFVCRIKSLPPDTTFTREGMNSLFMEVRQTLVAEADRLGIRLRDLACTTLVAVLGPSTAVFAQLGDGAIIVGDGLTCRTVFWPEPAEYANATDFLTDEYFADPLQFTVIVEPIAEVALLTDGLQRLALNFTAREAYAPFFRPLFDRLHASPDPTELTEPFRAFLDSLRVNERTDDDKTLVLAVRRP